MKKRFKQWLKNRLGIARIDSALQDADQVIQTMRKELNDIGVDFRQTKQEMQSALKLNGPRKLKNIMIDDDPLIKNTKSRELLKKDAQYICFEDIFRGPESAIRDKQSIYVKHAKEAFGDGSKKGIFLDAGCGRGEFLELLKKAKVPAKGLEQNNSLEETLSKKGLDFEFTDVNVFLENSADESLLGISALHFIEHQNTDYLRSFIELAHKKTAPGGIIIIETVNPNCSLALSHFYLDITHEKPYSPEAIKFFVEAYGYNNVQLMLLSPCPEEFRVRNFLDHNYQEYAVIGVK